MQCNFYLPATGEQYFWDRNPDSDGEDEWGLSRPVTRLANTTDNVAAFQQGDPGPTVLPIKGTILRRDQHEKFLHWYWICTFQTIYYTDFDNQVYEGIITSYKFKRLGKLPQVSRDPSMTNMYIKYTMEFTIMRLIAGEMLNAGVVI